MSVTLLVLTIIMAIVTLFFIGHGFLSHKIISNKVYSLLFCVLAINLAVLSCYFTGGQNMDLSRYYEMLDKYEEMSFSECLNNSVYKSTPLTVLLFWTVAQIGNFSILTLIPVFIIFICLFYIVIIFFNKFKDKTQIQKINLLLSIFFLLSFISSVILFTTVRFPMAISLMAVAFFRDIYLEKKDWKTYLLYAIPCLIHNGVLYMILIRIIIELRFLKILLPMLLVSTGTVFRLFAALFEWIQNNLFNIYDISLINKFAYYMQETSDSSFTDWRKNVANIVLILILLVMVEVNLYCNNRKFCSIDCIHKKRIRCNRFKNLILFFLGISLIPNILERSLILISFISIPIVFDFLNNINKFNIRVRKVFYFRRYVYFAIILIGIAMFYYQSLGWKAWSFNI